MNLTLKAGFARVDITPAYSVPLAGYGNTENRMSQNVLDPIYATCVAISDGENTALMYQMDLTRFAEESVAICKKAISENCGVNPDYIFFTSTHTHSAPDVSSKLEVIQTFLKEMHEKVIAVAPVAIADLEEAEIWIGKGKTEGLNFVRRYLLSDGSYGGDNFGDFKNNTILAHETEADPEMQVIRLRRTVKKDILMVNWQAHPHRTGGFRAPDLSSDLIDHFRQAVEGEHGVNFAFYQGCAGNLNSHSRIREENGEAYYREGNRRDYVGHGKRLAATLSTILPNMRKVKAGKIVAIQKTFVGEVNHATDALYDKAVEVIKLWNAGMADEARALAKDYGFNSVYHCMGVERRFHMPETHSYPIFAMAIGDLGFSFSPNELYDTIGTYLKATAPFEMTFVCGYTNGGQGYIPTIKAFKHGGYGCDTCRFPSGIAEKLTSELLNLLVEVSEK